MNKKTITLVMMLLLAVLGAKADVIPSSYYSEPAAGTYYIYNVTEGKFLRTVGVSENNYSLLDAPEAVTLTAKGETVCKGGGDYILSGNTDNFIKIGYWGGQWLWPNAASGNADILAWTFNSNGTKTYTMSITLSEAFSQNGSTFAVGTHYMKDVTNLGSEAEAGTYALITEANYYAYLASATMIPSTYYTTTPSAGTYYLYNIERSGFLYRGGDGNYAGLKATPATLTLTSNGSGAFYIKFPNETKYLKTGEYNGYFVWTDATDESFAWTFESFHGVTGLFTVKCPLNDVDRYLYSLGIGAKGVNAHRERVSRRNGVGDHPVVGGIVAEGPVVGTDPKQAGRVQIQGTDPQVVGVFFPGDDPARPGVDDGQARSIGAHIHQVPFRVVGERADAFRPEFVRFGELSGRVAPIQVEQAVQVSTHPDRAVLIARYGHDRIVGQPGVVPGQIPFRQRLAPSADRPGKEAGAVSGDPERLSVLVDGGDDGAVLSGCSVPVETEVREAEHGERRDQYPRLIQAQPKISL